MISPSMRKAMDDARDGRASGFSAAGDAQIAGQAGFRFGWDAAVEMIHTFEQEDLPEVPHRRFLLVRGEDVTGMSGVGVVAEGIAFSDGVAVVRWVAPGTSEANRERGVRPTTVVHENVDSIIALHGHNGATWIEWIE